MKRTMEIIKSFKKLFGLILGENVIFFFFRMFKDLEMSTVISTT